MKNIIKNIKTNINNNMNNGKKNINNDIKKNSIINSNTELKNANNNSSSSSTNNNTIFKNIVDVILCMLIVLLSIKKGGFYTSDIEFFVYGVFSIFAIYIIYEIVFCVINKFKLKEILNKTNYIVIIFFMLCLAYILPIMFGKAVNENEAIFETLRYLSAACVLIIVYKSNNKKMYIATICVVGVLQCFLGIDGISMRYLYPYLRKINSGYLTNNLTRLSGTIEYANTTCIMIAISACIILNYISNYVTRYLKSAKESVLLQDKKQNAKFEAIFTLFTICNICILLTKSRYALICYLIANVFYVILCTKECRIVNILSIASSFVIASLAYTNITNLISENPSKIYYVVITYIALSLIVAHYIIYLVLYNRKIAVKINGIVKNKRIVILIGIIILAYFTIALNVYSSLNIKYNEKENFIERQIYGIIKDDENKLEIEFTELEEDTRYAIKIYLENTDYEYKLVDELKYYENTSGKYIVRFTPDLDSKRIVIRTEMSKGSLKINKVYLNSKEKPVNYLLLNGDIMFRFKDILHGSTSTRDRIEYIKDSIKIWNKSKIIGMGGEAFKNMYKYVQTLDYSSTEAHSVIFQTLVETGIFGIICLITIVVIYSIKGEKKYIKIMFFMYMAHSIFDLNFSYLTGIITFALLIAVNIQNVNTSKVSNKDAEEKR